MAIEVIDKLIRRIRDTMTGPFDGVAEATAQSVAEVVSMRADYGLDGSYRRLSQALETSHHEHLS